MRRPTPAAVRTAVSTVLAERRYAEAARRIAGEFAGYPGGEPAARHLERLAGFPSPARRGAAGAG